MHMRHLKDNVAYNVCGDVVIKSMFASDVRKSLRYLLGSASHLAVLLTAGTCIPSWIQTGGY